MHRIQITNLEENTCISYPLVLLEGYIHGIAEKFQDQATNLFLEVSSENATAMFWPVAVPSGRYKAYLLLPFEGAHTIHLKVAGFNERKFDISYKKPEAVDIIRFYYQKCADAGDDQGFDAPDNVDNSDKAAISKIQFNALLLQTTMAELMHAQGLGRCTFVMELDANNLPIVPLLRSSFDNATARSIHDQKLINLVKQDIEHYGYDKNITGRLKHEVILGCSTFSREKQAPLGHTALGGSKVGVFGSCGLHTWPSHLGELTACCLDNRQLDTKRFFDDSCYRRTFWSNYSTGIGAFFHEMGHTLGLRHATDGIMSRGFDDMNRIFSIYEANHRCKDQAYKSWEVNGRLDLNMKPLKEVLDWRGAVWNLTSALKLSKSDWLTHGRKPPKASVPVVRWKQNVCGPVGFGDQDGEQHPFGESANDFDVGVIKIKAGNSVESIQCFSRDEVKRWDWNTTFEMNEEHIFALLEEEYILQINVRAMCWVDAVQICTNMRTTRWYGGCGGQQQTLKAANGWHIASLYGSIGNRFVGTIGAYCQPGRVPLRHPFSKRNGDSTPGATYSECMGKARGDGNQTKFTFNQSCEEGAIVVTCDDRYVKKLSMKNKQKHMDNVERRDGCKGYGPKEHVLDLVPEEYLTKVEVRSGFWIDALRFHTNKRVTGWIGGRNGSTTASLVAPPDHKICGFYGSHGNNFLGSVGACFGRRAVNADLSSELKTGADRDEEGYESFSLLQSPESLFTDKGYGDGISSVLVSVKDGVIQHVESNENAEGSTPFRANINHQFVLRKEEEVIQLEGSVNSDGALIGFCLHTTSRCSSWYGQLDNNNLRFYVAPEGHCISSISSIASDGQLVDIVGTVRSSPSPFAPLQAIHQGNLDHGQRDVRLEATDLNAVLEYAFLMKRREREYLDFRAWRWHQVSCQSPPRRWCLPHNLLTSHLDQDKVNSDELVRNYAVGAIDSNGYYGEATGSN